MTTMTPGYVVRKEETEGVVQSHMLNPNVTRRNASLGDMTGLSKIGFRIYEVEPGFDSTEFHFHHYEEECIYILEGEGTARIGEDTVIVYPGDFIGYRAGGEAHMLTNSGSSTLKYIVVGQRLDHDVVDYPRRKKRLYIQRGMPLHLVDTEHIEDISSPSSSSTEEQEASSP